MKRYENALSHLGRCLQIRPNDTNAMIDVGLVYLEMKKYTDAVRVGQKIAEKENNAMAYFIIGKARYGLGNLGRKRTLKKQHLLISKCTRLGMNSENLHDAQKIS